MTTPGSRPRRVAGSNRSPRGAKPKTSRAEILATALRLLDAEGQSAVNLRRIATELGLTPMTLYGYFDNKEDLITAMVEAAMPSLSGEVPLDLSWPEQLAWVMRQIHNAFTEHPGALELLLSRSDPDLDPIRETLIGILCRAGFDNVEAVSILMMLTSFATGSVVLSTRRGAPAEELRRLRGLSKSRFPYLRESATAYARRGATENFEHGLSILIRAVEASAPR